MSFSKQTIKDRVAVGDNKFSNSGTASALVLVPTPDSVTEAGTSVNASLLQRYENALYATGNNLDGGSASGNDTRNNHSNGIMGTKMTVRRDTATNWSNSNPVLGAGEIGYDTTNKNIKVGDGSTAWNNLPFVKEASYSNSGIMQYTYGQYTNSRMFVFNSKSKITSFTGATLISKIEEMGYNSSNNLFYMIYSSNALTSEGFYASGGKLYRLINGTWTDITSVVTVLWWNCCVSN